MMTDSIITETDLRKRENPFIFDIFAHITLKTKVFMQQLMEENNDELTWRGWVFSRIKEKDERRLLVIGKYRVFFLKSKLEDKLMVEQLSTNLFLSSISCS